MEIGYELKKRLPKARIRYVIDRDKFGYAEFGDYHEDKEEHTSKYVDFSDKKI